MPLTVQTYQHSTQQSLQPYETTLQTCGNFVECFSLQRIKENQFRKENSWPGTNLCIGNPFPPELLEYVEKIQEIMVSIFSKYNITIKLYPLTSVHATVAVFKDTEKNIDYESPDINVVLHQLLEQTGAFEILFNSEFTNKITLKVNDNGLILLLGTTKEPNKLSELRQTLKENLGVQPTISNTFHIAIGYIDATCSLPSFSQTLFCSLNEEIQELHKSGKLEASALIRSLKLCHYQVQTLQPDSTHSFEFPL